jgi:hypothetical protein
MADSQKTVGNKLVRCNLDLIAVQEVRWDRGGSQPANDYTFFYGNRSTNHYIETKFSVNEGIRLLVIGCHI